MKSKTLKLFAFIMAIVLVVSCGGCVADRIDTDDEEKSTATPTEVPTETPTATPEKETVLQVRGSWENNVYTNTFLGLSYTLPEDWQAATDEEILSMMGLGAELLGKKEDLEKSLESQQSIYDFYVVNDTTGSNINISFENLSLSIGGILYSEEDYADVVTQQLQSLEGMTYIIGAYEEVTLGDKTFLKVPATVEYSGISMEQQYYFHKEGKYMCSIILTCTSIDTKTPEQIMESFTKA